MISHKHIGKIIVVLALITVGLCLAALLFADLFAGDGGGAGTVMEYESELFDTDEIISINIIMDEEDWQDMLQNAISEEYYECDAEINGQTFYHVGIRPKGNTSLTSIANDSTTDRYSFKLEFDQYVDGQTCYGLDKLVLNNNYADATNMKEALIYDMYQYLQADASLYNYAKISVNGEYWGLYLALEAVEESFLSRNYGTDSGELYKPDSVNFGDMGGERGGFETWEPSQMQGKIPEGFDSSQLGGASSAQPDMNGAGQGFSIGGSGADLNYIDDDLDSYSAIWESEVTSTGEEDHKRVVDAIKNISEGTELEKYMDIDNLLKYMAVHVFSVNEDSLSGTMAHNYYLYEEDGQLNLLPWDYNLSLGGMGGGNDATSVVNDAIDEAFSGTDFFDTLMENEEYHEKYYQYLRQLVDEYLLGDGFETFYTRTRSQIDSLAESDPTAFYTYDAYTAAAETLYEVVKLRGQSIEGQLEGTIPSTQEEQSGSETLIDASHIDLSVMGSMDAGSMNMGGRSNMDFGDFPSKEEEETEENGGSFSYEAASQPVPAAEESSLAGLNSQTNDASAEDSKGSEDHNLPQAGGQMTEGFDGSEFDGELPEDFDGSSFDGELPQDFDSPPTEQQQGESSSDSANSSGEGGSQRGFDKGEAPGVISGDSSSVIISNLVTYGICLALLAAALLFAKLYRRKSRRR